MQGQTVDHHDYTFWCGDLNYRVDLPTHTAKDYISQARWDKLTKQDQLNKQRRAKKVRAYSRLSPDLDSRDKD